MKCHPQLPHLALSLALIFSATSVFSQVSSPSASSSVSPSTASDQGASDSSSPQPAPTWDQLDEIWTQLEQSGQTSSTDLATLKQALKQARQLSTVLSEQLQASTTKASELSSSLERASSSLQASVKSLASARVLERRHSLNLSLWRLLGLSGGLGVVGGALGSLQGQQEIQDAEIGLALGAVGGVLWGVLDFIHENSPVPEVPGGS